MFDSPKDTLNTINAAIGICAGLFAIGTGMYAIFVKSSSDGSSSVRWDLVRYAVLFALVAASQFSAFFSVRYLSPIGDGKPDVIAGPIGPAGPQGIAGPAGPPGPTGAPGATTIEKGSLTPAQASDLVRAVGYMIKKERICEYASQMPGIISFFKDNGDRIVNFSKVDDDDFQKKEFYEQLSMRGPIGAGQELGPEAQVQLIARELGRTNLQFAMQGHPGEAPVVYPSQDQIEALKGMERQNAFVAAYSHQQLIMRDLNDLAKSVKSECSNLRKGVAQIVVPEVKP